MPKTNKETAASAGENRGGMATALPASGGEPGKGGNPPGTPIIGGIAAVVAPVVKNRLPTGRKGGGHSLDNSPAEEATGTPVTPDDGSIGYAAADTSNSLFITSLPMERPTPVTTEVKESSLFSELNFTTEQVLGAVTGGVLVGTGALVVGGAFRGTGGISSPTTKVSSALFSHDTGSSNSDLVTNDAKQTISGTLSTNLAEGEMVAVSVDNGAHWTTATAAVGQSNWQLTGQTLSGSNTLKVKVVDGEGHDGAVYSHSYAIDSVVPSAAVIATAIINKSGVISGTAEAGATVHLTVAGSSFDATTGTDGNWSYTLAAANLDSLSQGSGSVSATVTDLAGNTNSSPAIRSISVDTVAPTTSVTTAIFSHDTGTSGSDYLTNDAKQALSGLLSANLVAGESVYVSTDNGTHWSIATATVGQNSWSIASQTLSGSNTFKVKVSDTAGNDSSLFSHGYMIDTTTPAAPVIGTDVVTATGLLNGTAEAGSTVHLVLLGANHDVIAGTDGGWSYTLTGAELNSVESAATTVAATVSDAAGNTNSSVVSHTISFVQHPQLPVDTGPETFVVDGAALAALAAPSVNGQSPHITGGAGLDTLAVSGSNLTLDLSQISSQSASDPGGNSRLVSIENIDLGNGANRLNLSLHDLFDMGSSNIINAATKSGLGWTGGSFAFSNSENGHQLIVDGTTGDQVTASGFTDTHQTAVMNGHTYEVYTATTGAEYAQLLVDQAITRTGMVV